VPIPVSDFKKVDELFYFVLFVKIYTSIETGTALRYGIGPAKMARLRAAPSPKH
jgi:hypothetical protein